MGDPIEERAQVELGDPIEEPAPVELVISMNRKLHQDSPISKKICIFRVPSKFRRPNDENIFEPSIVSIGPFHRGKDGLAPMEKIKWWYLHCFFNRCEQTTLGALRFCVDSCRTCLLEARQWYAEPINLDEDNEFIEMMVLDGCFLIELFKRYVSQPKDERKDDPIFGSSWMLESLYRDLILLENQIPWFILQNLFLLLPQEKQLLQLPELVLKFFSSMMLISPETLAELGENHETKHILDLLRSCLFSSPEITQVTRAISTQQVPPVTDLLRAGVKFKRGSGEGIFNIKFNKGELEIPPIIIKSNSESLFANLIAYEQCYPLCSFQFTSYALFLDCLINTVKDVDVLYRNKILRHDEVSVEDVSFLFNRLYNCNLVYDHYYGQVSLRVNKYYTSLIPRWMATLKREYFRNPWRTASIGAAVLVLTFTGAQTVIAMLAYYNVPHF